MEHFGAGFNGRNKDAISRGGGNNCLILATPMALTMDDPICLRPRAVLEPKEFAFRQWL